jgi:hypothetical protein
MCAGVSASRTLLCYNRWVAARVMLALAQGARAFLKSLARALRRLWHEVIGSLFVFFALAGGVSLWRHWKSGAEFAVLAVPLTFSLVMAGFAVASFRAARRAR